jgi:hypothetical protein
MVDREFIGGYAESSGLLPLRIALLLLDLERHPRCISVTEFGTRNQPRTIHTARNDPEVDAAFPTFPQLRASALLVMGDSFFTRRAERIGALAARYVLPAMFVLLGCVYSGVVAFGAAPRWATPTAIALPAPPRAMGTRRGYMARVSQAPGLILTAPAAMAKRAAMAVRTAVA